MNASNYQPNRSPIMVMTTVSDFFTDPSDPDFDTVVRQGLLRPFDTETGSAVPPATGLAQRPQRQEQYTGNQTVGVAAPWLRAYPDPEGFGSSSCNAACWDKLRGFWYVVDRRAVGSSGVFANRLFKCHEWLDTDAVEIATIPLATGELVKDIHVLEVANTNGGFRPVLVLRIGRDTFPTNMADWYGRLCWMEVTGGALREFQRISFPRVVSGSSEVTRDLLWSMCVGGIGNNRQQQGPRQDSDSLFGLVDRNFWANDEIVRRQQGITRWTWNVGSQTFGGGGFGQVLIGSANDEVDTERFTRGTYWKRINWNPFVQNGGGAVMFPALTMDDAPFRGGGSVVTIDSRIAYPAGFDNRGVGILYKLPLGPAVVTDVELDIVRSTLHPSECWVDLEGKLLTVHMAGGWGGSNNADRAEARKQLGLFAYAPIVYPGGGGGGADENLHRNYRQQMTGSTDAIAGVPYTYPARIIPGPGFY